MAIRIGPLAADDPLLTNEAVDPPPTLANIATRFVLVPPELWPGVSPGGWVAKVISADQRTEVRRAARLAPARHALRRRCAARLAPARGARPRAVRRPSHPRTGVQGQVQRRHVLLQVRHGRVLEDPLVRAGPQAAPRAALLLAS